MDGISSHNRYSVIGVFVGDNSFEIDAIWGWIFIVGTVIYLYAWFLAEGTDVLYVEEGLE